ncbi:helix-turn-helix domain-containing protein [Yersinia enterocolitica]|uniref:LexA family protein n=1 Tax=Yersinia TaxID=629 RepID=UPI0022FE3375|nr:S24 family peptidase [Yersinia enterocolitica]ELI8407952.1 helix-turn-helix domain-containing protein [Yersinia enterocolitica]MDA5533093.1 helix-turn-helix domain-containing protein [Yersinia enterocolitica]HDL6742425.1 helix-turn-helix domain-containing protein [Yersinia enterocolitica]HDL7349024.1 helix-turn-helix domain-containing protein [Yersinia enterocolitica]HDL8497026.1 helix-turn-helix domain-containing protein [Yersinia enterocolitica]
MGIAERVKARRDELGMTQSELALKAGTTQQSIVNLENGTTKRPRNLLEISKALNTDPDYLMFGKGISNVSFAGVHTPGVRYPVISKVQAGAWAEAVEVYTIRDIELWLESDAHVQGDAFWLEVDGDSMTAPVGLSVPEGTFVLFDTGREPVNGNLVIAKLTDSNEVTFKKLVIDGGLRYLKGLNPAWPLVPINGNCKIIGVAVETKLRLV